MIPNSSQLLNKKNLKMEKLLSFYLKNLVPMIGDEVFLVKNCNSSMPLRSYIIDFFFKEFGDKKNQDYDEKEINSMKKDGYYGISKLRNAFNKITDFEFYYANIVNSIKDNIIIHPVVEKYIHTIRPKLILTTSPFKILDNLFPSYNSLWYYPAEETNFKDISAPTICHIFGKAGECNVKWVVGEEELLEFLHAWNNSKSLDRIFISRFQEQGLLVLGCDSFPDWIFRFLWYPLRKLSGNEKGFLLGDEIHNLENNQNNRNCTMNLSFAAFLKRINYDKSEKMYDLLDKSVTLIMQKEGEDSQETHDFFISYASEDKQLALEIKNRLESFHLNVWLDKDRPHELDGRYWAGIDRAIENSHYFMPIVTHHYVERFFCKSRVKDNKVSALEDETGRIIASLSSRYNNDEDVMISKIIPVLKTNENVKIFHRNKEIEEVLNTENIDKYSSLSNPCFWIFNQINFKFYSDISEDNTFLITDWSIYKKQ